MCLSRIARRPWPKKKSGYTVFRDHWSGLRPIYMLSKVGTPPVEKWEDDPQDYRIEMISGKTYRTGFHIFYTLEAARLYRETLRRLGHHLLKIHEVKFDKRVTVGYQEMARIRNHPIVVARRRFVGKEVKDDVSVETQTA